MTWPVRHTQKHYTVVNSISPWAEKSEGKKISGLPKWAGGGGSVFKCLLNSHFGLSNPSHVLALVLPSQPFACLQSIYFVCELQHVIPSFALLSDFTPLPLSGSFQVSSVLAVISVACVFIHFPPFWSAGLLPLCFPWSCETLWWPRDLESSIRCLCTLGGEHAFSAVIRVIKAASL